MGSYNIGIFIYTILQCLLTSFVFSLSIFYMAKRNIDIKYRITALIFYIALPIFGFYSTWLTKDILFTVFITMLTIGIIELSFNKEIIKSKKYIIFMICTLLISMFLRKNGVYVSLILGIVVIVIERKNWKQILTIFLIPIILFKIVDGPIRNKMGIEDGSKLEMFSIPAQQMARIYKYDFDKLDDRQKEKIKFYITDNNIEDIYDPVLSDPIKAKLNADGINNKKMEFITFCIELAIKYPVRTIQSFLCTTYKFYYIDNDVIRGIEKFKDQSTYVINNMLPYEMNIKNNKFDLKLIEQIDDNLYKKDIPVLSTLTGSGIYIIIYLICIGYLIYTKRYRLVLGFLPIFILLLTQFAGPVVDQRYSYSVFTCLPILLGITFYKKVDNNN